MRLGCLCVIDKVNGLPVVSVHYPSSHGAFNMAGRSESSMEESALVTLIPDCQAGGKITGHWSTGHGITVHASEGKPTSAQPLGHYRFPVLHEVKWHADVHTTIMRKLINETHGIFLDLQQLPEAGGTSRKSSLLTISRRYRAVLRSCLLQLKDKIDIEPMAVDGNQNTSTQKQLLTFIELVWHLCEILFIESLPGGAVLPRLLEWSKTEDTDKYVAQVLQYPAPHESPAYWPAIYSLVLHGQLNDARELLAQHPDSRDQLGSYDMFESMDELLRRMPLYQYYMGQTSSEFLVKWNHWQHECKSQLESDTYVADPCLQTLCEILAGKEEVFDESILKDSCPTWYQMLTAKLLYCNPVVKVFDLQYHTQSCIEMFGGDMGSLDKILLSAFEFDVSGVIKQSSESFGSWWFVAHLTDLLDHAGQLDSNQISSPISLREFLLLEYSASLMSHHSLWQIAVDYLKQCPQYGRAHLEEYVEHLPLETEKKALKVLRLCEDLDMSVQAQSICKTMSMRALRNSRLGSALSWCLRSKDSAFAAFISDRFLEEYIKCGGFSNLDLIDNLGSAMLLSDRLTFLGKYREFHKTYEECRFQDAAALLISLLTSKLAPKSLWLTLLTDALPLLEHEKVIFSSNQTYELMHCLEEIRLSFRSSEYMDLTEDQGEIRKQGSKMGKKGKTPKATKAQGEEEQDRVDLLRLAMARNLARAILKEGQLVN